MIKEFVLAWDANKDKLSEYIASHKQECYNSYNEIVKMLFEQVINPYMKAHYETSFNVENIHEIDDGHYQGTLLYMIPADTYQPSHWQYVATYVYYGSCSGCDTLLGISGYSGDLPDADQVKDYVELCLNILQHCKYPFNYKED